MEDHMRASMVGMLAAGAVVVIAFALPVKPSAAASLDSYKPKCGAHGWVLGAIDSSHIYDVDVDKPATPDRSNPKIPWPGSWGRNNDNTVEADMRTNAEASVVAKFVVDTVGCIDSSTFKVVSATDTSYSNAVAKMLPRLHYEPAVKDKQKVRSWVLWKFQFFRKSGATAPTGY
jgi:hypothetical protein